LGRFALSACPTNKNEKKEMIKKIGISHKNRLLRDNSSAYGFLSPTILLLLFIFAYQIINLLMFSLVKWQGIRPTNEFNNFSYFVTLFKQGLLYGPLLRSLALTAIVIPVVILLTTFLAHNIYRKVFGWKFYRWIIFITSIIPVIVASIVWTFLLNAYGPINNFFRFIHLDFLAVDWFGNAKFAIIALCWIIIWRELGFSTIIFLAQLTSADFSVYEAAIIDGANEFQLIRYVTFPALTNIIKLYTITMTIYVLNNLFGVVLVSTGGGPGYATTVLEYYIYYMTFRIGKIGIGAAVSVVLFIITFILILIYIRFTSKNNKEGVF
jgi:multiple sugar transport system permease protein